MGAILGVVGIGLTLGIITAFMGLPFAGLGVLMLAAGGGLVTWRSREAQRTNNLLSAFKAAEAGACRQGISVLYLYRTRNFPRF
jgi:hypothetical protein